MSAGSVSKAKRELVDADLITIIEESGPGGKYHIITIKNIWPENVAAYSSSERNRASVHQVNTDETSVHQMNAKRESVHSVNAERSPGETKKNPYKKNHNEEKLLVDANASTPVAEKKQAAESPLIPDTPASQLLFKKLVLNAAAKHRRGPGRFPTLECEINFDQAAKLLDGEFDEVLNKALKQGITSVVGVTNYIAKWASNMQKKGKPQVIQVGN